MTKNINKYYVYVIFTNFIFQRGIFIIFLADIGFSSSSIGVFQAALYVGVALFEIPSGYIADKWGRKYSVSLGLLLLVIEGVSMVTFPAQFGFFFALMIISALGTTLVSGADQSLLYDSLVSIGREKEYLKINGRVQAVGAIVLGMAMSAGGWLQAVSWNYVYLAYSASYFVALTIFLSMDEPVTKKNFEHNSINVENFPLEIKQFFKNRKGKWIFIFMVACGLVDAAATPYFIYGQIQLEQKNFSILEISLFYSLVQFLSGIAYILADSISSRYGLKALSFSTLLILTMLMGLTVFSNDLLSILILLLVAVLPESMYISTDAHLHDNYPNEIRASLASVNNFIQAVFIGIGYVVIGGMMEFFPISTSLASASIFCAVAIGVFSLYFIKMDK